MENKPVVKQVTQVSGLLALLIVVLILLLTPLATPLFSDPHSTILRDRDGYFLSGIIADDEQWRFPASDKIPEKFKYSILYFEDKNFYKHMGIDFPAIYRALLLNIKNRRVISGGSTISMQVIRLSRKGQSRTLREKCIEALLAFKLELKYTKDEILNLYSSYAPFGGNVVGLDAASWRYFGVEADLLSWGESAALAVLPNSPGLIYPGRNLQPFKEKRDKLLNTLNREGVITDVELSLALAEELPQKPYPLPRRADHLLQKAIKGGYKEQNIISTIDKQLQQSVTNIINTHHKRLKQNYINNIAVLVMDINSGEVLSYIGNVNSTDHLNNASEVDIVSSQRSTGSLLKPILYALAMDDGLITPKSLVSDTPLFYEGFSPRNYNNDYSGVTGADIALQRSLNIPFVTLLHQYNYSRFNYVLDKMGLTMAHSPDHYGLSIILGGSEVTLWDISGLYASMARSLNNYTQYPQNTRYSLEDYHQPIYIKGDSKTPKEYQSGGIISAGSLYTTFKTMEKVSRPSNEISWELYESSIPVSWKTGTSFGFRDAWSIGVTKDKLVGVWVGNADGEGRPDLVGVKAAAPVMFDIFKILPTDPFFTAPVTDLKLMDICNESGQLKGLYCPETEKALIPIGSTNTQSCTYHKLIHLNREETHIVDDTNYKVSDMVHKPWFILPPIQEWYFKQKNSDYKPLPPQLKITDDSSDMMFIYPVKNTVITIPRELNGEKGSTVFEVAHRNAERTLYWHLDNSYVGKTKGFNKLQLSPNPGEHTITVIDNKGVEITMDFTVLE